MRRLILTALAAAALAAATPVGAEAAKGDPAPNVVMIVSDDQTLASYSERTMPNAIRLLGGSGTTFTDAIVTTPLCCPSRATMLTGQYGHNNGVLRNNYDDLKGKRNVLPAWLRAAGYRTIHVGKFLNRYAATVGKASKVAPGWDEWHSSVANPGRYFNYELQVNGRTKRFGGRPGDYLGRVLTKRATKLIARSAGGRKPFYLQLDHFAPHPSEDEDPGRCRDGAIPDPLDYEAFAAEPLPMPPSFNESDVSDKPSFIRELPPLDEAVAAELQRLHGCALASLPSVDRSIAQVHRAVKRAGELRRTVFIFLSDNGYYFGEHRIPASKQNPYEEGIRVPLVISAPKRLLGGKPPARVDLPVANLDLPATILELAGARPCRANGACRSLDGRSLVPLLEGKRGGWPRDRTLVVELDRGKSPVEDGRACSFAGVRNGKAILVEHRGRIDVATGRCAPISEYELYDLERDPFQLDSLHSSVRGTAPSALERKLTRKLAKLRRCAGTKGPSRCE